MMPYNVRPRSAPSAAIFLLLQSGAAMPADPPAGKRVIVRWTASSSSSTMKSSPGSNSRIASRPPPASCASKDAPAAPEVLEKQMLERMINDRALMQLARDTGLRVDDTQLDRALHRIAEENRLSMDDLRQTLERDGILRNSGRNFAARSCSPASKNGKWITRSP